LVDRYNGYPNSSPDTSSQFIKKRRSFCLRYDGAWNYLDTNMIDGVLNDPRLVYPADRFENRVEPANAPSLRSDYAIILSAIDPIHNRESAPAPTIGLTRNGKIPSCVADQRHYVIYETGGDDLAGLTRFGGSPVNEDFDNAILGVNVVAPCFTLTNACRKFRRPVVIENAALERRFDHASHLREQCFR
jgi:hypothetical protein